MRPSHTESSFNLGISLFVALVASSCMKMGAPPINNATTGVGAVNQVSSKFLKYVDVKTTDSNGNAIVVRSLAPNPTPTPAPHGENKFVPDATKKKGSASVSHSKPISLLDKLIPDARAEVSSNLSIKNACFTGSNGMAYVCDGTTTVCSGGSCVEPASAVENGKPAAPSVNAASGIGLAGAVGAGSMGSSSGHGVGAATGSGASGSGSGSGSSSGMSPNGGGGIGGTGRTGTCDNGSQCPQNYICLAGGLCCPWTNSVGCGPNSTAGWCCPTGSSCGTSQGSCGCPSGQTQCIYACCPTNPGCSAATGLCTTPTPTPKPTPTPASCSCQPGDYYYSTDGSGVCTQFYCQSYIRCSRQKGAKGGGTWVVQPYPAGTNPCLGKAGLCPLQ